MSTPGALTPARAAGVPTRPPLNQSTHIRSGWECTFAVGVTFGPAGVLLAAVNGPDSLLVLLVLGWVMTVPFSGIALLIYALLQRDVRSQRALVTAVLALVGSMAALPAIERMGVEIFLSRRGAELETLVREVVEISDAEVRASESHPGPVPHDSAWAARQVAVAELHERARRLGFYLSRPTEGGVLLMSSATLLGTDLLYREDPSAGLPRDCLESDLRFAGGRWYVIRCRTDSEY